MSDQTTAEPSDVAFESLNQTQPPHSASVKPSDDGEIAYAEPVDEEDLGPHLSIEPGSGIKSLSLKEAALILGKSIRGLERSLAGKWGNKLPEGWSAARRIVGGKEEWQIVPPAGFRYEHILEALRRKDNDSSQMQRIQPEDLLQPLRAHFENSDLKEVHGLLKELAYTNRELAEQRKVHLEDLRTLLDLQSSMRLLEVNSSETVKLKAELIEAQKDLITLRDQYKEFLGLPWWKRLFMRSP